MSYVDSTLIDGETVLHRGQVSWWPLMPWIVLGVLTTIVAVGIGILAWVYVKRRTTELAITNKRVIAKKGFIQRDTIEMFLSKVESVHVDQSVMGRVLDYGTVIMSGTGMVNSRFENISAPLEFRKRFMAAADKVMPPQVADKTRPS
jgi:uncharacterized membrane protein YdbT with pleckstrin-like domain